MAMIDLGNVTKPANTLIVKISELVGGVLAPLQIKRLARAEVEANLIKARGAIDAELIRRQGAAEFQELERRAVGRFLHEQQRYQLNIEAVAMKALPGVEETARPEQIEDDWIVNFFEHARLISDEEMQSLWARVLAGQANSPGRFSRRTVNLLASFDKVDAELFTKLCGFCWSVRDELTAVVFDWNASVYNEQQVNFEALSHLDSIGLIHLDLQGGGYVADRLPSTVTVSYFDRPLTLNVPRASSRQLPTGAVLLTKSGIELAPIAGGRPVSGFWEYTLAWWTKLVEAPADAEPASG